MQLASACCGPNRVEFQASISGRANELSRFAPWLRIANTLRLEPLRTTAAVGGMPVSSCQIEPTLVAAVRRLSGDTGRGFVFFRPDGTERFWSFSEMSAEAERRGASLARHGLKKGDRLALVIPEGEDFVLSFLAALFAGIVPVPIVPQLSFKNVDSYHANIAHIVEASGASLLVTTATTKPFVDPVMGRVGTLRGILTVDDLAGHEGPCGVDIRSQDVAFLQFTSGSTSRPKGVVVTHANLAANSEAFMVHGIQCDPSRDRGVSWLPLFHDMGLIGFVVGPLFTNIPCVFLPTASFVRAPRLWLDKIHEHRATITYAPNFAYALVAKRLKDKDVESLDLSSLRVAGCGAEPIQARTLRAFASRLAPAKFDARAFVASYGMAEATLAITFAPLGEGLQTDRVQPSSISAGRAEPSQSAPSTGPADGPLDSGAVELVDCGTAFPQHEVAIVNEVGARLPERQVGQIVVRGPSVTNGYFNDSDATARTYKALPSDAPGDATWLHSGDLGYMAGGRLFVCGRLKDVIIVRGRNYYPSDIEWAVSELPNVRRGNVVAFGVSVDSQGKVTTDLGGDEQLVVCCEGAGGDATAIREAASACISAQFGLTPHEVVVSPLASLPRTSSGKPQRRSTRQMYLDGTLPRARSVQVISGRDDRA